MAGSPEGSLKRWLKQINEAREKAIRDHNSQMSSALRRGMKQGMQQGMKLGQASLIRNMLKNGVTPEAIAKMTDISLEEIEAVKNQITAE